MTSRWAAVGAETDLQGRARLLQMRARTNWRRSPIGGTCTRVVRRHPAPRLRRTGRAGIDANGGVMIRSGKSTFLIAAALVGMLAALVPATPAVAAVAASPLPGTGPGMAYDAADGQVVLFGGSAGRTWTWDGSDWTRRTPLHSPPPSPSYYRYGMAYDAANGQVVLFGGVAGDTWTWDGTD